MSISYSSVSKSNDTIYHEINNVKDSVGHLISVNTFLLTVLDSKFALESLAYENSNHFYRLLFYIEADPNVVTTKHFADISEHNYSKYRQVLFVIGSIFRVTNVEQSINKLWIIRITLCSDNDPDLRLSFGKMKKKYKDYNGEAVFLSFSRVLRDMKKFNEVEKYCHRLLDCFSSDKSPLSIVYNELAVIAANKGDYNLSKQWHQKSSQIMKETNSNGFWHYH